MNTCKLFIASSLDGFIARKNGSLDWLDEIGSKEQTDAGYLDFINTIDTIILGRNTYEEILSFGIEWPYKEQNTIVVTSQKGYKINTPKTSVINTINSSSITQVLTDSHKNIWVLGGGKTITEFLNLKFITEITITIIPIILGEGIKLFPNHPTETKLKLINAQSFESGMVNLSYTTIY